MPDARPAPCPEFFPCLPLEVPRDRILSRLGYHKTLTHFPLAQRTRLEADLLDGFDLCQPQGVRVSIPIDQMTAEGVTLACGSHIQSRDLAGFLAGCSEMLLVGASVGVRITQAIEEAFRVGDGVRAAVFDATASETVDAALGWLHRRVRLEVARYGLHITHQRFSPGYGDLKLEVQRLAYDRLGLQRLNVSLNDQLLLVPEKTVIGIAGIRSEGASS